MARKARNAFYTNNARDQLECEFVQEDHTVVRAVVNKASGHDEDEINPDWDFVHEQCGHDEIETRTRAAMEASQNAQRDDTAKTERMEGEILFNMKLKIFEIEEIRASKNSKMKSKIRRSDDPAKVSAYAGALIAMEEMNAARESSMKPDVVGQAVVVDAGPVIIQEPSVNVDADLPAIALINEEPAPVKKPRKKPAIKKPRTKKATPKGKTRIVDILTDDKRET